MVSICIIIKSLKKTHNKALCSTNKTKAQKKGIAMKKQILAIITLLATTALSVNAYYDNDDYRPHTLPGRTVDATGNVVTGTGRAAGTVVEGTGRAAGTVVTGAGEVTEGVLGGIGGIFTGKSREERRQDREDRRQQREQKRKDSAARRNQ